MADRLRRLEKLSVGFGQRWHLKGCSSRSSRKNCLVAVSGGLRDGTSGLQEDDSYAATRREIERFTHIIFSSTPSQRDFCLGKKPGADSSFIEKMYGALKPCLHGSDAHEDSKIGTLRRLKSEIEGAQGAQMRRQQHSKSRREDYGRVFTTLIEEQSLLERLYAPLRSDLADAKGALTKLQFIVKRHVDLDKWVLEGERLLDLRKASEFQGHGTLKEKALQLLVPVWQEGTAEQVAAAMDDFREKYQAELLKGQTCRK